MPELSELTTPSVSAAGLEKRMISSAEFAPLTNLLKGGIIFMEALEGTSAFPVRRAKRSFAISAKSAFI